MCLVWCIYARWWKYENTLNVILRTVFVASHPSCLAWKGEEHQIQKNSVPYYFKFVTTPSDNKNKKQNITAVFFTKLKFDYHVWGGQLCCIILPGVVTSVMKRHTGGSRNGQIGIMLCLFGVRTKWRKSLLLPNILYLRNGLTSIIPIS